MFLGFRLCPAIHTQLRGIRYNHSIVANLTFFFMKSEWFLISSIHHSVAKGLTETHYLSKLQLLRTIPINYCTRTIILKHHLTSRKQCTNINYLERYL